MIKKQIAAPLLVAIVALSSAPCGATQATVSAEKQAQAKAAEARLNELERKRRETQERLREAKRKERMALQKLNSIKQNLYVTTDALNASKHKLEKTERKMGECEQKLTATQTEEEVLSEGACKRLRQIYEGQRLGLVEMLFQVSSLQSLLDLFYYQERIAAADRGLLEHLRQKKAQLDAHRKQLGSQKNRLGDLVSEFAMKALQLNKEKLNQEQVAEKLRTQRAFYEQAERQLAQESLALERQIVDLCAVNKEKGGVTKGSGTMILPLKAPVTSPFGYRRHPIFGVRKFHTGVDLAGPNHSPIKAADSGNVLKTGYFGGYGKVVIVDHGHGRATLYAHLSKTNVSPGQNVTKGDIIGYEGSTGFSTGPHLHFEVRIDGKPNNPMNFVH